MKEKIKKYIGEILLLIGIFMFVYNVFNFSSDRGCGLSLDFFEEECKNPITYSYRNDVHFGIGLGAMLLAAGILLIKRKNN